MTSYAKVVVMGTPITKSNFKLINKEGRSFLPMNSGKYHDRYANYEQEIAFTAMSQNPGLVLDESLIAILRVYYKSEKRHPDTNNITKSIFDGIEKSGLIINDAQITRLVIEEYYDRENPRFELELFGDSEFNLTYQVLKRETPLPMKSYDLASNKKGEMRIKPKPVKKSDVISGSNCCSVCKKPISGRDFISADAGRTIICRSCFNKLL
ncbi:RusA family crossover junction endodeoxyribonuclease [Youngiibacter multivorans]|uniref:Holliday junction resolvase RusA-like endonuclease n=1 Tax=Youngiibacter multivorans TaxID=937251 RepID=A0ABS4G3Z0_9CLOT|nr:RusA family crossover junction endodeoxyribonuclease [Youngiibacter multivorans]MBP1919249.1 Holliday junction resolvase RusA-like endonuclease [Youngiibacter multivorans]